MTLLVVDASVLVAAVTESADARWAERVLADAGDLLAPQSLLAECANVLRRARLARSLTPMAAAEAYGDLLLLDVELVPYLPFARRIWELGSTVSAYDAWYVAIAEVIGSPLATLDLRLARAKGPRCEFLTPT